MGVYSEYLDRHMDMNQLTAERKKQLRRIRDLRGKRDILVYAADVTKVGAPIAISYEDELPIKDQMANLKGDALDLILETPGGSGEAADDIVHLLRGRYAHLAVIVPGMAKSAGTIMTMAADEILMEPGSALGPIDAQLTWQGKTFSAQALLDGMQKIKEEVDGTNRLNRAYIPILNNISPGELQSAQNALDFAKSLVTDWLVRYKFREWVNHSSTNEEVTSEHRRERAEEIAFELCNHARWLTHGRSIRMDDLQAMRLKVGDYSATPELAEAVRRYYTLMQMTFDSNIYKVFETTTSQIYRFFVPQVITQGVPAPQPQQSDVAVFNTECGKCKGKIVVQANLGKPQPLQQGAVSFPADNRLVCGNCGNVIDVSAARRDIEARAKKRIVQ